MKLTLPTILVGALIACLVAQGGCARSTGQTGQSSGPTTRRALSTEPAAVLAAQLANEQCERQYRRRPFKPEQHSAILLEGLYHWGELDVAGVGGFSAVV